MLSGTFGACCIKSFPVGAGRGERDPGHLWYWGYFDWLRSRDGHQVSYSRLQAELVQRTLGLCQDEPCKLSAAPAALPSASPRNDKAVPHLMSIQAKHSISPRLISGQSCTTELVPRATASSVACLPLHRIAPFRKSRFRGCSCARAKVNPILPASRRRHVLLRYRQFRSQAHRGRLLLRRGICRVGKHILRYQHCF